MGKNLKIIIFILLPLLAACSTVRKIDSPTGVTYEATCVQPSETFMQCFNQAAKTCPKGYTLIDAVDQPETTDVITEAKIPPRRNLYFHCKDLR